MKNGENPDKYESVLTYYRDLLSTIERILAKRNNYLLPRQANVFTTNYDLLLEKAGEERGHPLINDGFRRVSALETGLTYSADNFFVSTFHTGNLYSYRTELPSINLLKLHGSLSWQNSHKHIQFNESLQKLKEAACEQSVHQYLKDAAVIFPERGKFAATILTDVYYTLLRMYFNSLERENSLLLVFGFSFADEHIYDITCRALRNPTLHLLIFAYSESDRATFEDKFSRFNNVEIVRPGRSDEYIDFAKINDYINVLPQTKAMR